MEYFIIYLVVAVVCGFICSAIASSRNMEGGFWWGFWLGIIGIIIVAVRPNDNSPSSTYSSSLSRSNESYNTNDIVPFGGWRCNNCGKPHQGYETVCSCGTAKDNNIKKGQENKQNLTNANKTSLSNISEADVIKYLKEYKDLLDAGIITSEEFEKKKRQLLDNQEAVDTHLGEDVPEEKFNIVREGINPRGEKAVYPIPSDEFDRVLCPKCKTKQRANRHLCQKCGTPFMYEE